MTQLEEYREQMDTLKARMRLYQLQLGGAETPEERDCLRRKLSTYRTMIRELQEQIDHLDPPQKRKRQKEQRRRLDIGAMAFDWFERSNTRWSDLEGHSWAQVEAGDYVELGADMASIQRWLQEAAMRLTDRQALYVDAYYNGGRSLEDIGAEYGVDKTTVSRVIRNGLERMRAWVESKRLIRACSDGAGGFDWVRYLAQVPVLTDRQRQLMLLVLSRMPRTQGELADKLELSQTTVCRTIQKGGQTLRRLSIPAGYDAGEPPVIRDWEHADQISLAAQTGMGLGFCYRYCFRNERYGNLTRYQYELYRRLRSRRTAEETAQELGLAVRTVRRAWSRLRRLERVGELVVDP